CRDRRADAQAPACLDALPQRAARATRREARADHARTPAKIFFHQQRHGGKRDRGTDRAALDQMPGCLRAAPQLQRALLHGAEPHGQRIAPTTVPGIHHIANAYCYRCPFGLTYPSCELKCAKDLEEAIQTETSGRVAALVAEPIQGVGGYITPPKEYFSEITSILKKYGGLFICDEVQTGWGRTGGKMFGIEHWGVEPDIMTFAKGMANGVPIGATIASPEVADSIKGLT